MCQVISSRDFQKSILLGKIREYREKIHKSTMTLRQSLQTPTGELVTDERRAILKMPINKLILHLRTEKLKPTAVLEAFQVNCYSQYSLITL